MKKQTKKPNRKKEDLNKLLREATSKDDETRYNTFKVLQKISQNNPKTLYKHWSFFENLLTSKNTYHKSLAVQILANLTKVDTENKFQKIFNQYYNLMNDSIIVARNIVANSGKIATAKPDLQDRIIEKLMNIDETTQKHKDLLKGDAIESFDLIFEHAKNKKVILNFVKEQRDCESPRTRKIAEKFLNKRIRVN
jgi:hypothetical protein